MVRSSGDRAHAGWDLYSAVGSLTYAVSWGVVAAAEGDQSHSKVSYGNYVAIKLLSREAMKLANRVGAKQIYAFYAHLFKVLVKQGDPVWQGRPIGLTGNTGNAGNTPPHLHFEVRTDLRWDKSDPKNPNKEAPLHYTIDPGDLLGYQYYSTSVRQRPNPL
jgi:murein DD-endopeptidase MepM/ murein hydrolase activator NlpD